MKIDTQEVLSCMRRGTSIRALAKETGKSYEWLCLQLRDEPGYKDAIIQGRVARREKWRQGIEQEFWATRSKVLTMVTYQDKITNFIKLAEALRLSPTGALIKRIKQDSDIKQILRNNSDSEKSRWHRAYGGGLDEEVLEGIRSCARESGKTPTGPEYHAWSRKNGRIGTLAVMNRFGSWNKALEKAGWPPNRSNHGYRKDRLSDEVLWKQVKALVASLDHMPSYNDLQKFVGPGRATTIRTRFGGWSSVKRRIWDEGLTRA